MAGGRAIRRRRRTKAQPSARDWLVVALCLEKQTNAHVGAQAHCHPVSVPRIRRRMIDYCMAESARLAKLEAKRAAQLATS